MKFLKILSLICVIFCVFPQTSESILIEFEAQDNLNLNCESWIWLENNIDPSNPILIVPLNTQKNDNITLIPINTNAGIYRIGIRVLGFDVIYLNIKQKLLDLINSNDDPNLSFKLIYELNGIIPTFTLALKQRIHSKSARKQHIYTIICNNIIKKNQLNLQI